MAVAPAEAAPRGRRWPRRLLVAALVLVLVVLLAAGGLLTWSVRRAFPTTAGRLSLPLLDAPVDVYRDARGIPTIVASSERDLVRAQGFVHAQERFWQMDVARHVGAGRLAELFGPDQLPTDRFLRTVGWERASRAELAALDDADVQVLTDYADGVNAYVRTRPQRALGLEYTVLGLSNGGYRPEPWEPVHTLLFLRLMAWDLRGNIDREIEQALLEATYPPEQVADLFPPYPAGAPRIVPELRPDGALAAALADVAAGLAAVEAVTGPQPDGAGSNSWVIAGDRTASGAPILANDPHLGLGAPSIWFANGLRCRERGPACDLDVTGFSLAGVPGVITGHNDRIAWGVTNLGADVMDLYVERIHPDDPTRYEVEGSWVEAELVSETLRSSDGASEELLVRSTRHGPIISGTYGPLDELEQGEDLAIALRWTALEPTQTVRSIMRLNRARGWEDFRAALADFAVPSQNFVYADVDGNIGYQAPGRIPVRAAGNGTRPAPGWDSTHGWTGWIDYDDLPRSLNPPEGVIVTANQAVEPEGYAHFISDDYDYGHRAARITQLLAEAGDAITVEDVRGMQGDNRDPGVEVLVPALLALDRGDERVATAQELLAGWDGQMAADSAAAAMYAATFRHTLLRTFDELPERYRPGGRSRWVEVLRRLLDDPGSTWWDDPATAAVEDRDATLAAALADAVDELRERLGDDPSRWRWGSLHTATFRNGTLGQSGIAPIERLFNRGGVGVGGGFSIVNATGWNPQLGYEVVWHPSFRSVVDLGDLDSYQSVHPPGNSGHAFHRHYSDTIDAWAAGEQHPRPFGLDRIAAEARAHLRLEP
jgi:penicillin G amidase